LETKRNLPNDGSAASVRPTPEVKFDILIPTYNRPRLLDIALRNAFSIALPQCRIVVIDDGSEISQELDDGTTLDTAGVVERHEDSRLVYHRFDRNRGLGAVFETYLAELLNGEDLMIVGDDDVLIDGAPIQKGLDLLDSESKLSAVMFPIRQKDHLGENRLIELNYTRMNGHQFLHRYVDDDPIKHVAMYGLFRTEDIYRSGGFQSMGLREKYGLDDAFGIDTDFLFRIATVGGFDFIQEPHLRRQDIGGITERFPVSFAYCYYQYVLRALKILRRKDFMERRYQQKFVRQWLKIMLMSYSSSLHMANSEERGSERIRKHLKYPIHLYILLQLMRFHIWLDKD